MKRRLGVLLVMVLAIAFMGANGYAMPVRFESGALVAQAINLLDESVYDLNTEEFQLIGRDVDGGYLIFADQQFLKVGREEMSEIASILGLGAVTGLPRMANYEVLSRYSKGEPVAALQDALKELGYLTGSADGSYGGQSQRAVSALQAELGLEETGEADELLQMLVASMIEEERVITPASDPAAQFEVISGKTNANLDAVIESGLGLEYDDIAGVGMISDNTVISYDASGSGDIDQYEFSVQFGLLVRQADDGEVIISPVAQISCLCVRRPIMEEVILKSGDERHTIAVAALDNALSGAKSIETGTVFLDEDAVNMLANVAGEGELKLRVEAKYQSFDIVIPQMYLESIASVGRAAQGL